VGLPPPTAAAAAKETAVSAASPSAVVAATSVDEPTAACGLAATLAAAPGQLAHQPGRCGHWHWLRNGWRRFWYCRRHDRNDTVQPSPLGLRFAALGFGRKVLDFLQDNLRSRSTGGGGQVYSILCPDDIPIFCMEFLQREVVLAEFMYKIDYFHLLGNAPYCNGFSETTFRANLFRDKFVTLTI
jgi:hypothetical protein